MAGQEEACAAHACTHRSHLVEASTGASAPGRRLAASHPSLTVSQRHHPDAHRHLRVHTGPGDEVVVAPPFHALTASCQDVQAGRRRRAPPARATTGTRTRRHACGTWAR